MISLRRRLRLNRRIVIVTGGVAVLLIVGGYLIWSSSAWANYHTAYSEWKSTTKNKISSALDMPATTAAERTKKLQALQTTSEAIATSDKSLCSTNILVDWQQSVNATYKKWQQECLTMQASAGRLNTALISAVNYLQNEHELATILSTALGATSKTVTESSLPAVVTKWKTASADVKSLKASAEFTPVKTKSQKVVDGVESAWNALIAAHTAKDETKYGKALTGLTGAYLVVDDIETESAKQFAQLSSALEANYKTAL
jgi:hypothetical protein